VALVANPSKAACREAVRLTSRLIQATGREVWMDEPTASLACRPAHVAPHVVDLADRTDLLMVFGGDGTMLRVAREAAGSATPMLGINAGGLGFLTAVPLSQLQRALSEIWAGRYSIERRHLMSASGRARGRRIRQTALNDFVIGRGSHSRMVELEVSVDGEVLTRYRCDGVIVSSPTGSTAYSLAAGGAVVCPSARVFALTPICPHTLSNRSVIIGADSRIQVRAISSRIETILTADGQVQIALAPEDSIVVQRSRQAVCLLHLAGSSFFATLRQKLGWSGSHIL